jgi:hypothetical protein
VSAIDAAEVAQVSHLLDAHLLSDEALRSCIAAALREARVLVGRDAASGHVIEPSHGMTWAGALMYLVYCEQIGSCFHLVGEPRSKKEPLRTALKQFGKFADRDAVSLTSLRNRLAHDFTLAVPAKNGRAGYSFVLHGSADEPVVGVFKDAVFVGLPAFAHRVETTFQLQLLTALEDGRLGCHHAGGLQGVRRRFYMGIVTPDTP